jgi:pyruvate dehydrogenase E2 component (dihydrolipoamide acetyltransferase)
MAEAGVIVPLSAMRKAIAIRMSEAALIPHFRLSVDIEADALIQLRETLRSVETEVSLNDLLVKACAAALIEVPAVNVNWTEGELRQFSSADISVVMALDGGLTTPIVRQAETKSVAELSSELKELRARATRNALKVNEILGGTFSLSNLGMYGIDQFDAIINPPQCAILAVGRVRPSAVVSPLGKMRIASVLRATLSADHRAIDGATGAKFLSALRRHVEQPDAPALRATAAQ